MMPLLSSAYRCVLARKILALFCKNAFGRCFRAEGSPQVFTFRQFAETLNHPCMPVDGPVSPMALVGKDVLMTVRTVHGIRLL